MIMPDFLDDVMLWLEIIFFGMICFSICFFSMCCAFIVVRLICDDVVIMPD